LPRTDLVREVGPRTEPTVGTRITTPTFNPSPQWHWRAAAGLHSCSEIKIGFRTRARWWKDRVGSMRSSGS